LGEHVHWHGQTEYICFRLPGGASTAKRTGEIRVGAESTYSFRKKSCAPRRTEKLKSDATSHTTGIPEKRSDCGLGGGRKAVFNQENRDNDREGEPSARVRC